MNTCTFRILFLNFCFGKLWPLTPTAIEVSTIWVFVTFCPCSHVKILKLYEQLCQMCGSVLQGDRILKAYLY